VLGEKAPAWMQRTAPRLHRRLDDALDIEVARRGTRRAEHDDLATARVRRLAIRLAHGKHRHDAKRIAGTRNAPGDLAAIGDQEAVEQRHYLPSLTKQASALDTSNLPGSSISIDLTLPSSIIITPRRQRTPMFAFVISASMPSAFENAAPPSASMMI